MTFKKTLKSFFFFVLLSSTIGCATKKMNKARKEQKEKKSKQIPKNLPTHLEELPAQTLENCPKKAPEKTSQMNPEEHLAQIYTGDNYNLLCFNTYTILSFLSSSEL